MIIKEQLQAGVTQNGFSYKARCVIRTEYYSKSLRHIESLAAIAKADFPTLTPDGIEIVHYGGDRYKGTYGIEFTPPSAVPDEYQIITTLERTL